jgi:HK97 family phage major capsid protein
MTTGTGTSQPQGMVVGATLGKTGASATAIAADELLDLIHSVDPAYRGDPSAGFMFHDNILLALRKLKDTTNQYLIQPRVTEALPSMIQGFPFTVNQSMASAITTGQKTMLFGALRKYQIRDVSEVRLVRLNELFAQTDQVGFVMFMRSDAKLLNAGTNPIKYYAQL